jgi:carboxyl-terminal processing protease
MSHKLLKTVGLVGSALACFGFGFVWKDVKNGQLPTFAKKDLLLGIKTNGRDATDDQVFKQTYSRILANYPTEQDRTELKYSAMEGLVAALGDPHSIFFVPKINTAFRDETQGKFYGIGARLLPDPLGVKVTSVFADGPAQKSGLKAEDVIIAVDGKVTAGMNSDDIVTLIKGQENTVVNLRIMRPNVAEPINFAIKRAKVVPPSVEGKYFADSKIGYLKLLNFNLEIPEQFDRELEVIESNGLKGLVIDLRDNPGGALECAVDLLSRFFENKRVVSLKARTGEEEVYDARSGLKRDFGYEIIILINEESASAAEIMAGVLQDYKMVKLLGEHSYGKFSVQTVFPQRDGAGIKLTIAKYYLPKSGALSRVVDEDGQYISGGLKPDIEVAPDQDQEFEQGNPKKDNQLAKAIEVLTGKS